MKNMGVRWPNLASASLEGNKRLGASPGLSKFSLNYNELLGGALFPRLDQHIVLLMGNQKSGNHQLRLVVIWSRCLQGF